MTPTLQANSIWQKLKRPLLALGVAWIVALVVSMAWQSLLTLSVFIALNAAAPFIVIFLTMFAAGFFKAVEGVGWLKLVWIVAGFLYLVVANKWAGDLLNDIFKIDPSYFPTTSSVLVLVFGPLLLYGSPLWGWFYAISLITLSLLAVVLPVLLMATARQKLSPKGWLWGIAATLSIVIWVPLNSILGHKYPLLVERLAVWADFYDKHRCANLDAQKVVFLKDGNVLALRTSSDGATGYVVLPCTYERPKESIGN